jgi:hypothetical protein
VPRHGLRPVSCPGAILVWLPCKTKPVKKPRKTLDILAEILKIGLLTLRRSLLYAKNRELQNDKIMK